VPLVLQQRADEVIEEGMIFCGALSAFGTSPTSSKPWPASVIEGEADTVRATGEIAEWLNVEISRLANASARSSED
jgi:hypothetical protein